MTTPRAKPDNPVAHLPLPRLISHFISRIDYQVFAAIDPSLPTRFAVGGLLVKDPAQPHMRELRLSIELKDIETSLKLIVEIVSQVDGVPIDGDISAIDRHVLLCVAPTLLSAAREQVINLTAHTIVGTPLLMPLMPVQQLLGCFQQTMVVPPAE